jgi:hypothetical protein
MEDQERLQRGRRTFSVGLAVGIAAMLAIGGVIAATTFLSGITTTGELALTELASGQQASAGYVHLYAIDGHLYSQDSSGNEYALDEAGGVSNFVPYTGATADVDLGEKNFTTTGTIEGRITRDVVLFASGKLKTGDPGVWVRLDDPSLAAGDIVAVYAVLKTPGTSETTIDVLKCTQTDIDGTPSWVSIFSTPLTLDADERSSNTAEVPAVLGTTEWTANDHLRLNVDVAGTGADNLTVKVRVRLT